jgi:hypothetical protein
MTHPSSVQTGESKSYEGRRKEKTTSSWWAVEIPIFVSESSRDDAWATPSTKFAVPERGATRAEEAPKQVAPEEVGATVAQPGTDAAVK